MFEASQICPQFAHRPPGRTKASQCGPWGLGQRGSPDSGEAGSGAGRGGGEAGSRSSLKSDGGQSWCWAASREVRSGAREMRLRRVLFRRREDQNQPTSDSVGFSRCLGADLRG
jgi:hypothetical protein